MLKIKDNVDLKELEKFKYEEDGIEFRFRYSLEQNSYNFLPTQYDEYKDDFDTLSQYATLWVNVDYRYIQLVYGYGNMLEIIYDLIQAGLVEKVEEE